MTTILTITVGLCTAIPAAEISAPEKEALKPIGLEDFIDKVVAEGTQSAVPGAIAGLIGVAADAPVLYLSIDQNQTTDGMIHVFEVVAERNPATGEAKPVGLLLKAQREKSGKLGTAWFSASLVGKLERAVFLSGKLDGQGNGIKGSGVPVEKDIGSAEVKKKFQHELDLWLKRSYLKKEWKSVEFSGGVLTKETANAPPK